MAAAATQRRHATLHRRLLGNMLLMCLVPLLLVGGAAYVQFQIYASKMVQDQQERLVLNHRDFIESYLRGRSAELAAIANQYTLEQLKRGELERVFAVIQQGAGIYTDIGIIDDKGSHLKYVGPYNLAGRNYSTADWFRTLKTQDMVISDLFMGYRAVPHFIIAVKHTTPSGYWILRASLSTDYFSQLVERIRVGSTGEAFLLDRRGLYQTKTVFDSAPLQPSNFPFLSPHEGVRTVDLEVRGRQFLCSNVWIMGNQWLLVFRQERAEAFAPLQRALWTWALITLAALAVVSLATFAIAKNLVGFVARADAEKASLHAQLVASSKMAAVGEMAAGVAHELNNPLGIIETLRTWILDLTPEQGVAADDVPEIIDSARKIGDQVERCRRITHDLLKFSRKVESERTMTDVNALLREMLQMVEHRAKADNVTFHLDAADLPSFVTSPSRLQQIVLNILNNAVDAMEGRGGTVMIRTLAAGDAVRMIFKDSGCGIPEEILGRIFEPFFTTKPVGKGTGLGLAVCYGLVQQMGGTLEAQSQVGVGTTFTLTLPVSPPQPPVTR